MRFLIEYKDFKTKETDHVSLNLLDTFLNEHLIGSFHGHTFECINVRFINHHPTTRKLKLKSLYKTIAEIELSGSFINANKLNMEDFHAGLMMIEEAIHKVYSIEVKDTLDYKGDKLLKDYKESIKLAPMNIDELKKYKFNENEVKFHNNAKRADCLMDSFFMNPRPLTKTVIGIRIYDQFDRGALSPFNYMYTVIFSNLLRKAEVKLPNYDEIYINIAETLEMSKQQIALETWHKYTYATLDLSTYLSKDDQGKSQMFFESVCSGLRLIAEFDHLEKGKIEDVIKVIAEKGLEQELVYASKQNNRYLAEIIYTAPNSHLSKAEYKLRVTDLQSGQSRVEHIDYIDTMWAPYSFGKINIKKDEIIIKGRESLRAEISRQVDKLPKEYRFKISDVLRIK
jgi:hypothetical protein